MHYLRAAADVEPELPDGSYIISCRDAALCYKKLKKCLKKL